MLHIYLHGSLTQNATLNIGWAEHSSSAGSQMERVSVSGEFIFGTDLFEYKTLVAWHWHICWKQSWKWISPLQWKPPRSSFRDGVSIYHSRSRLMVNLQSHTYAWTLARVAIFLEHRVQLIFKYQEVTVVITWIVVSAINKRCKLRGHVTCIKIQT